MIVEVFTAHGGGRYWRRLLVEWQRAGHTVREFYAFDDANYRRGRGSFGRLWLRFQSYGLFPLKVWLRLCWRRAPEDTVRVVITSPFYLPFIIVRTRNSRRRTPTVNVLNDLFPDALIHAGMLRPGGWFTRQLEAITRFCIAECEATVFLGSHLMAHAEQTYGKARVGRIIPVGADSTFFSGFPPVSIPPTEPIRILYSGTMGHVHDIDTLVEAARRGLPDGIHLTFHSSGVGYGRLRSALVGMSEGTCARISLQGPQSDEAWRETLKQYPIALVTLKNGAERVSMPSKTYSALAAGQAILAICATDSDLAELVLRHGCGWVVPPGQAGELNSLLSCFAKGSEELQAKRLAAFRVGQSLYDMAIIAQQYLELFEVLLRDSQLQRELP